jgi:hypothetical protein
VRRLLCGALALVATACVSEDPPPPAVTASGPPRVDVVTVQRHAEQFDDDLGSRPAGSQEEFLAATYILGHLQQAGYVPLLDAVPVGNLVRSTNVVAPPPAGRPPAIVVAVAYDAGPNDSSGDAVGTFLELARALAVREPNHGVEFVALGAERTTDEHLGARRLAKQLVDDQISPVVITLEIVEGESAAMRDAPTGSVFAAAGFAHRVAIGSVEPLGRMLLDFLADR